MGLTSAFGVGQSALAAYQAALQTTGNNIANAATPGYARLNPRFAGIAGLDASFGQIGNGVRLMSVRRSVSESLQARLRTALGNYSAATAQRGNLNRIEGVFNPLGDAHIGSMLDAFFKSIHDLQNSPEDSATRGLVINTAQALSRKLRDTRNDVLNLRTDLNRDIELAALRGDQIATRIAELNTQITTSEAGSQGEAAALRTERDQLLTELAEYFDVTVRDQPTGAVNVYVGSSALVQFGQSFGLTSTQEADADGLSIAVIRFKVGSGLVQTDTGSVAGLVAARDTDAANTLARLESFASSLIREVNRIHAGGQGLRGFDDLTGLTSVIDPATALSSATNGIAFVPQSGSFFIDVKDASGSVIRTQINIDLDGIGADTTLDSLAADITANVADVTATVQADGTLHLTAATGRSFTFADDTSGVLGALGLNTFFVGTGSGDINVSGLVADDPQLIAAARTGLAGDGSNATAMAVLRDAAVGSLNGASLSEYQRATVADIAVRSAGSQSALEASEVVFDSLTAQRESVSGVSLDDEAINMLAYQRAYEGAARYMIVVDEMLQTLIDLIR